MRFFFRGFEFPLKILILEISSEEFVKFYYYVIIVKVQPNGSLNEGGKGEQNETVN